jgi:hypothetical protein
MNPGTVNMIGAEAADRVAAHLAERAATAARIAELEDMLRRALEDEWTVLHEDIEDAIRAILAKKA